MQIGPGVNISLCFRLCLLSASLVSGTSHAQLYRPEQERRTVNTERYEIIIQKNGQVDVRLRNGALVFDNAAPAVQLAGEDAPKLLPLNWKRTNRQEVHDALGQGQGFKFAWGDCEWYLRTYPTQPFFTAQVVYINTSREPVRVERLIPWTLEESGLRLGGVAAAVKVLDNGRLFETGDDTPLLQSPPAAGEWNVALYQPQTGRSLIAGFLTNLKGHSQLHVLPAKEKSVLQFSADCIYEPAVEVPPGGRLESEVLYLAVAESDALTGLRRFGKAEGLWNQVRHAPPFLPHGWDSWSTHYQHDISEAELLRELDVLDQQLKRYGWKHFAIDAGWEQAQGDWEPDAAKFPQGMAWFAEQIHARGMTAGLWVAPFSVARTAQLAKAHPEWLREPSARGKDIVGDDKLILDVTQPGAYAFARDLAKKITQEWRFDALMEADFVYYLLLAENYANPNLTQVEVMHLGMQALREGMGEDKFLMSMPPHPINGIHADGIRVGRDCAPVWKASTPDQPWGAVDALSNAIRRFYLSPGLYVMDQDCAFFTTPEVRERWQVKEALTRNQSIAWLTGAALTGGVVKIGNAFSTLTPADFDILKRLLPVPEQPARPIDLFETDHPAIWYMPLSTAAGEWDTLGLFNWDPAAPQTLSVDFAKLGLIQGAYYTVFDFWQQQYLGTATGSLSVQVPPGSVRLLGLRPYEDRPMFLAHDRHLLQGAMEYNKLAWDPNTLTLSGSFEAIEATTYTAYVLVPEPYQPLDNGPEWTAQDKLLIGKIPAAVTGEKNWQLHFQRN